ncbi:MAG TPA: hypothetical protein H9693_01320 [Firmicutes bacterium]|nr:hypothetical protein [Bacillota bacterium]
MKDDEIFPELPAEITLPGELYDQSKRMMWSMVQYKEMQMTLRAQRVRRRHYAHGQRNACAQAED